MLKPVILVAALAAPAVAQPAPPAPSPMTVKLTVKAGADTRVHELAIFEQSCGHVEDKGGSYEDDISVCAKPAAAGIQLEVSWHTRNGTAEYKTTTNTIIKRGGKVETGRAGGTRFVLQLS